MLQKKYFYYTMYLTKDISLKASVKDIDGKKGIITGYFANFNSLDSDKDVITPGAFSKTIKERGPQSAQPRVKYLRNHLIYEPIGVITELKEDNVGLYYEAQAGTHFFGQDTVKMIESGVITEHSFGFDTVPSRTERKDGVRYLNELVLWEGSALTAWGANERTGAAVLKSMGKEVYLKTLSNRAIALERFCKSTTATDETIELLLIEHKQLLQTILDLSETSTTPEPNSTLPDEIGDIMDNFIKSLKN